MRRRALGLGLLASACGVARAQGERKLARVAFVEAGTSSANGHFLKAFESGLSDLGYKIGRDVAIDVRWAEGRAETFAGHFEQLLRAPPDVFVVASTLGAKVARTMIKRVPVVFVGAADPVQAGLVQSAARPGGNVTGLSRVFGEGLLGKCVQLLRELVPGLERCGVIWNSRGAVELHVRDARAAIQGLGMVMVEGAVHEVTDLERVYAGLRGRGAEGALVITDPLMLLNRERVVGLAARARLPTVYEFPDFARAGGLLAYSADIPALFRRAAVFVDKILKGAQPAELPVEQPNTFELVLNLKTARALRLTVPPSLSLRADEVIE